jgi:hypothetical protein
MDINDIKVGLFVKVEDATLGFNEYFSAGQVVLVKRVDRRQHTIECWVNRTRTATFVADDLSPVDQREHRDMHKSEEIRDMERDYSSLIKGQYDYIRNEQQKTITDKSKLFEDLQKLDAKLNNFTTILRAKRRQIRAPKPIFLESLDRLLESKYLSVRVVDSRVIEAITVPIEIHHKASIGENWLTGYYPMGAYKVVLDVVTNKILVHATDVNQQSRNGNLHPHILSSGECCFGTYSSALSEYMADNMHLEALYMIHEYLSRCYEHDWYTPIYYWHENRSTHDLCDRCWFEDCQCQSDEYCSDCDCDECECTRCPDSGDRLADNFFPDSYCARCSFLCLNQTQENNRWECRYNGTEYPEHSSYEEDFDPSDSDENRYSIHAEGEDVEVPVNAPTPVVPELPVESIWEGTQGDMAVMPVVTLTGDTVEIVVEEQSITNPPTPLNEEN